MPQWLKKLARSWPGRFLTKTVERYLIHGVAQEAAALAYYLLFMIFPLLIFLSSLLGLLDLDVSGISMALGTLLPAGVVDLVESYLSYVSRTSSTAMLWFGLIFSIYFPMRAADCLMMAVRKAYHLPRPKNQILYMAKVLLYTVFLLVTIALTLALVTVGRAALEFAGRFVVVPAAFIDLWSDLRFLIRRGGPALRRRPGQPPAGAKCGPRRGRSPGGLDGGVGGVLLLCGEFCQLFSDLRSSGYHNCIDDVAEPDSGNADHGR